MQVAQYWNPYGTRLPHRHALARRVEGFDGWALQSIVHAMQPASDDYQCGIWSHIALSCLLDYLRTAEEPSSSGFDAFLAQQPSFHPIPPSGDSERSSATHANEAYATEVRATLRTVLWQAAVAQTLPHGLNAQLEHLGNTAAERIDLVSEDEAVETADDDNDDVSFSDVNPLDKAANATTISSTEAAEITPLDEAAVARLVEDVREGAPDGGLLRVMQEFPGASADETHAWWQQVKARKEALRAEWSQRRDAEREQEFDVALGGLRVNRSLAAHVAARTASHMSDE